MAAVLVVVTLVMYIAAAVAVDGLVRRFLCRPAARAERRSAWSSLADEAEDWLRRQG
jgi:hypothetical protein